jgi:serine/threonine-protein kinase
MEPVRIGRYEIHTLLGQGGVGAVYRGRDPLMDRWVAIKTLTLQDAHQQARFQQEIKAAGSLNHPNITTTYDVGTENELAYIVMELVEGTTLADKLAAPVLWDEAVRLLLPVCQALAYAHSRGVIHRDVKPANILISPDGQVKLTDFGLAKLDSALRRITESGSTVGTPLYTAPEQIRNEPVDGRADQFSLGIVLYELITGVHPFIGETLAQIVYRITQADPANLDLLATLAPENVVAVTGRALHKNPADRFPGAEEMAAALADCLDTPPVGANDLRPRLEKSPGPVSDSPQVASKRVLDYIASDLVLSSSEELLLIKAFQRNDRVFLEREFRSGYSSAKVLLATPVRSGRRLAQMVLKIDRRQEIEHEWQAYQEFVSENLPPVTARILEEPIYADDKSELGLLQYSFAGGLGNMSPESLRTYYFQHSGEQVAQLLEKGIFKTFGTKWWLQRSSTDLVVRREYARLLPVDLVLQFRDFSELTLTPRTLVAGQVTALNCRQFKAGQVLQLQGFKSEECLPDRKEITVRTSSSGDPTNPVRIRMTDALEGQLPAVRPGQIVPPLIGVVVSTRHDLLLDLAEKTLPGVDFSQAYFILDGQPYPNPLHDVEALLDQRISAMRSIIHGDLNLENVLVTPTSDLAWLIDFATTGEGHNLYDFARLETQVITKLLPEVKPADVRQMMLALHQLTGPVPAELQKPFAVISAIRRMVWVCLYSRENMDEYYLGLIVTLLGALKFKELQNHERRSTLVAASVLRGLVSSLPLPPAPAHALQPPVTRTEFKARSAVIALAVVLVLGLAGLGFLGLNQLSSFPTPSPTPGLISQATPTPLPTATLRPTATPSPSPTMPSRGEGRTRASLNIYTGPGLSYPPLNAVPEGSVVQITGRSADGKWWQIASPGGADGSGWILAEFVELAGDISPVVVTPPLPSLPTPTPTPIDIATTPSIVISTDKIVEPQPVVASMLEDFEGYSTTTIEQAFTLNNTWGENEIALEIVTVPDSPEPGHVLSLNYDIKAGSPDNYVGAERRLSRTADWSGDGAIQFWLRNDGIRKEFIFQFGETDPNGEIWKTSFTLEPDETRRVKLPLTTQYFSWADWSSTGNGQIDLDRITYYGFFIAAADPGQGVIYLDDLALMSDRSDSGAAAPAPIPSICQYSPALEFEGLWAGTRSDLGCATGDSQAIPYLIEESFEGGRMYWREDTDEVYLIYDRRKDGSELARGDWAAPPWKWDGVAGCSGQFFPPAGLQQPDRGFSWLWCTHLGGPNGSLGWALDKEAGLENIGRIQLFQHGLTFRDSRKKVYALLDDGRFLTESAAQAPVQKPAPPPPPLFVDTGFIPTAVFEEVWHNLGAGSSPLGYPTGAAMTDRNYAQQYFERGFMFWWEAPQEPQPIWVIFTPDPAETEGDTWRQYDNRWVGGQPDFPPGCPDAAPPLGPKSGFGVTWCLEAGVKAQIGRPIQAEYGSAGVNPKGAVQFFQGGIMFENPGDQQIWVLVNNGGWYRFSKR